MRERLGGMEDRARWSNISLTGLPEGGDIHGKVTIFRVTR